MLFLDEDVRGRYVAWEPVARAAVGFLRAAAPSDPRLVHLIGELSLSDTQFRTWWAQRHVSYATFGTRTYTHPLTGPFTLDWQLLLIPRDDQLVLVNTAPPGTGSLEALRRLIDAPSMPRGNPAGPPFPDGRTEAALAAPATLGARFVFKGITSTW